MGGKQGSGDVADTDRGLSGIKKQSALTEQSTDREQDMVTEQE